MKLFHVIATSVLGTAMALGTGFALANKQNVRQANVAYAAEGEEHSIADFTGLDEAVVINSPTAPDTINLTNPGYTIKQVIIGWNHNKSNSGVTATVTIGDQELGSGVVGGQKTTTTTTIGDGTLSLSGNVSISFVNNNTATTGCGTLYLKSLTLVEGYDASAKTMTIKDSGSVASDSYTVNYGNSGAFFYAYEDSSEISPTWESSDETIFTVEKVDKHAWVKGVKAGTAKLNATLDGYKKASVNITINPGDLSNIAVTGSMSTTSYTTLQSWKPDGLVVTANYSYGYSANVTSEATWTYAPAKPAEGVTSVVATASFGGKTASSTAQAVTVTVANDGSEEHPYTASEALEAATQNNVYVSGIISQIDEVSTSFGNATYYISDDGTTTKQLKVFRGKYLDNANFTAEDQIVVGDTVTIYGNITVYQSVNQMAQGNYLTKLEHHTLETITTIQDIYSGVSSQSIDVYGYYVGFLDGTGPVIMNGDYGVVIFAKTHDVSGYTEKSTILHVTGSVSIYKGLYEIAGTVSITPVESAVGDLDAPVVYAAKGGETADCASRLTTVTGYVASVTSGSLTADPQAADIKMNFQVGSSAIEVFYKKAAQDATEMAALKDSLDNSKELTVSGFTSWFEGFQVQMNDIVKEKESYTAEAFAQDLIDQTDAVCAGYVEGDNNHDAIVAIWSDLASADKYPSLPADQKAILAAADADEHSSDVVEQAMARYDFLTVRYNLNNFINGRLGGSETNTINNISHSSDLTVIIVTMSVVALVSSAGFFLVIRKRKHQ